MNFAYFTLLKEHRKRWKRAGRFCSLVIISVGNVGTVFKIFESLDFIGTLSRCWDRWVLLIKPFEPFQTVGFNFVRIGKKKKKTLETLKKIRPC